MRMTPTGNKNRPQAWFCCVGYDYNTRLCKNHVRTSFRFLFAMLRIILTGLQSEFHSYRALEDHINDFHNKTNEEKIAIAPNNFDAHNFNTNSVSEDPRRRDPPAYRNIFGRDNGSVRRNSRGTNANPGETRLFGTSRYHSREAEQFLRQEREQGRRAEAQRRRDSFAARLLFHYGPTQPLPENAVVCYGYDGRVDPTISFFESRPRAPTPPTPAFVGMVIADPIAAERARQRAAAAQALRHQEVLESESAARKGRFCGVRCVCM